MSQQSAVQDPASFIGPTVAVLRVPMPAQVAPVLKPQSRIGWVLRWLRASAPRRRGAGRSRPPSGPPCPSWRSCVPGRAGRT